MTTTYSLTVLRETFAVGRLNADATLPEWATGELVSVTRTATELSIVCAEATIPHGVPHSAGWRCLQVQGPLDFSLIGVLAKLTDVLAHAGISVFVISTYDTDYLLVPGEQLRSAIDALQSSGHSVA